MESQQEFSSDHRDSLVVATTVAMECQKTSEEELKPSATSKTVPSRAYACICDWENCRSIQEQCHTLLTEKHVWNKAPYRFRLSTTTDKREQQIKSLAFRAAVFHNLKTSKAKQDKCKNNFRIACHHFSIPLLENNTVRTKLLSRDGVCELEKDRRLKSTGYTDKSSTVATLLRLIPQSVLTLTEEEKEQYSKKYVQVPLVTITEVVEELESYKTPRGDRMKDDMAITPRKLDASDGRKRKPMTLDERLSSTKRQKKQQEPDDIYKSEESIYEGLISEYNKSNKSSSSTEFQDSEFVQRAVNDISFMARANEDSPTSFELEEGKIFHTCLSYPQPESCEGFKILSLHTDRVECDTCKKTTLYKKLHEQRKDVDSGNREAHSSRVRIGYMSPEGKGKRIKSVITKKKNQHKQIKRLQLKLKSPEDKEMVVINSDEVKSVLKEAFDHILLKNDRVELKQLIVKTLLEAELDDGKKNNMEPKEVDMFATRVCTLLEAESKKLSGDDKQVRYDFRIKRLALSHFLEFGVSGYQRLRDSSLEILPSQRTNEREFAHLKGGEGAHAAVFCSQFIDTIKAGKEAGKPSSDAEAVVQLIFDELKVKCGVMYNPSTGKESGFTASKNGTSMCFAEEILDVASASLNEEAETNPEDQDSTNPEEDKEDRGTYVGAATFANVFRLRTCFNQTWNVAYFFNSGSLSGDDIVKQLLMVITSCELVGLIVKLLMSDAGGGNTRALALLTRNKCNNLKPGKPKLKSLRFVNPLSPSRYIWDSLCSVHGLKNHKNMACNKDLVYKDKTLSWNVIIKLFYHLKENFENSGNVHQVRHMRYSVAFPDQFTKQNVSDAKQPFEEATIAFQCQWLANRMNCSSDFFDNVLEEYRIKDGYSDEILKAKVELLKIHASTLTENKKESEDELAFLEFSVMMHFIFIARQLNKNARLVLTEECRKRDSVNGGIILSLNIDKEMERMEECIKYFDIWRLWSKAQKNHLENFVGVTKWSQLCVSSITLRNLKLSLFGFLNYAKDVLENYPALKFVPYLHNNSSTLESQNSYFRATGTDTSLLLPKGLVASNIKQTTKLISSTSYSREDSTVEKNLFTSNFDLTLGSRVREDWIQDLIQRRGANERIDDTSSGNKVHMLPESIENEKTAKMKALINCIGEFESCNSYSSTLLKIQGFKDFAKASHHTEACKKWFENIILGEDEKNFNSICQQVNMRLLKFLIKTAEERKSTKTDKSLRMVSFQIKLINMLQDPLLDGIILGTVNEHERKCIVSVIVILNEEMERKQRRGLIRMAEVRKEEEGGKEKPLHVRDVNLMFGWAIFHLRLIKIRKKREETVANEKTEKLQDEIDFLSNMRMYAEEALLSESYLDKCYDSFLRSSNRGFMTLVSEEYFDFGVELMKKVSSSITVEKLQNDLDVTAPAKEAILEDNGLITKFIECSRENKCLEEVEKKKLYNELVEKVVNARFCEEFRAYRAEFTARGSENKQNNFTLRQTLDSYARKRQASTDKNKKRGAKKSGAKKDSSQKK